MALKIQYIVFFSHKLENTIDIAHTKCIVCKIKRPNFGFTHKKPTHCKDCKLPGMTDVNNKKCEVCKKIQPIYNFPGSKNATHCNNCKLEGMVDVLNSLCPKCKTKQKRYSYPEDEKPALCAACREPGMIDRYAPLCKRCNVQAKYNYPDEKLGAYCLNHKLRGMVDVMNRRCKSEGCLTRPNPNSDYEGHCVRCFIHTYPEKKISRMYKIKEQHVVDFVSTHFADYHPIYDKQTGGCSKRRPDIVIELLGYIIIIEIDENQHRYYDTTCEEVRMNELFTDFGDRPIIFIRFNPDEYLDESGKKIAS